MLAQIGALIRIARAAVVAALFALWRIEKAKADRAEDRADQADEYIATRKRIDNAPDTGTDADAARRWLRDRAKR
jgi:hypothetical protein